MKALHIGDMHASAHIRPAERRRAEDEILAIAAREKVDLALIPGDLYDGPPNQEDRTELRDFLVRLGGICPVVICRGNHDPHGEVLALGQLRTDTDPRNHRHPVYATEGADVFHVAGAAVACLSHFSRQTAIQQGHEDTAEFARATLQELSRQLADSPEPMKIFASHIDVEGATYSEGESRKAGATAITLRDLLEVEAGAVMLNHVHMEQQLHPDAAVWYAGSIYQTDMKERSDRKSVSIAHFDDQGRFVERTVHPLPQTPMLKSEARLTDQGWKIIEKHWPIGDWEWPEIPEPCEFWLVVEAPSDRLAEARTFKAEAERRYPGQRIDLKSAPVVERRCVDFGTAKTLADAYSKWRAAESDYLPPAPSLAAKLEEIEAAVGGSILTGGQTGSGLVLGDLEYSGINGATEPVRIPYSSMRGIICVAGENGAGKSTTFEASLAGLTREFAYYGKSVTERAIGGAYISQAFSIGGHAYKSELTVKKNGKDLEALLLRDGQPVNDPKMLRQFDAAIGEVVGSKEILELTVYARQADSPEGKQGFFQVDPAQRGELLIKLTGNERYQQAADMAAKRRKELEKPIAEARTAVDTLERQLSERPGLVEQEQSTRLALETQRTLLAEADNAVQQAIHAEAEIANLPGNIGGAQRELEEKTARRNELRTKAIKLVEDRNAQQAIANRAEEIRSAQLAMGEYESAVTAANNGIELAERALEDLQADQQRAAEIETAIATKERVRSEKLAAFRATQQAELHQAESALQDATAKVREAEGKLRAAQDDATVRAAELDLAHLKDKISAAEARLADLRSRSALIGEVACAKLADEMSHVRENCKLLAGARRDRDEIPAEEAEIADLQGKLPAFEEKIATAKAAREQAIAQAQQEVDTASGVSDQAAKVVATVRERAAQPADTPEAQELATEITALRADLTALSGTPAKIASARQAVAQAKAILASAEQRLMANRDLVAQAPLVDAAAARVVELADELKQTNTEGVALKEQCEELERRIAGLQDHERLLNEARTAKVQAISRRQEVEAATGRWQAALGATQGKLSALDALLPELEAAKAALETLQADHADWAQLERGFSRTGVQALAIDEAGPEIAEIVNQILSDCHGPRFTFGMTTQVDSKDGKKKVNRFEPIIFDRGELRDRISGGEGAILDLAVRLAIAVYCGRHSSRRYQVLWLDEAGQAIGVEHHGVYLKMIRLAMDLADLVQVLIISHVPEIWAAVDWLVRMHRKDGHPALKSIECLTAGAEIAPAPAPVPAVAPAAPVQEAIAW